METTFSRVYMDNGKSAGAKKYTSASSSMSVAHHVLDPVSNS